MVININSWHYRLLQFLDFRTPVNLCPYFWKVIAAIITAFAGMFAIALLASSAIFSLIYLFYPIPLTELSEVLLLLGIAEWLVFLVIMSIVVWHYGRERYDEWRSQQPVVDRPPKEPNIIVEFFKAKHEKVCPRLQFRG